MQTTTRYRALALIAVAAVLVLAPGCARSQELAATERSAPRPAVTAPEQQPPASGEPGTSEEPSEEPGAPRDAALLCDSARRIAELDTEASMAMNRAIAHSINGEQELAEQAVLDAISEMAALVDQLDEAYGSLEVAVPADLADDVVVLRTFTVDFMGRLAAAGSFAEFEAVTEAMDPTDALDAGTAAMDINELTVRECGVTITG